MIIASYQEALEAYANPLEFLVEPLPGGLINHSYKISNKLSGDSFLLQQINKNVFTDPVLVQSNYQKIWEHLSEEGGNSLIPEPKYFPGESPLFCDSHDEYWRVFEFIDNGQSLGNTENILQVRSVANTFASLTSSFNGTDIQELGITIPDFHNLSARYKQFERSIHHHQFERLQKASMLIDELRKRDRYTNMYDVFTESDEFPKRIMHHDAKIGNVLFDEHSGDAICLVDLDTCMPGHFFSDIGDMIRSMAVTVNEDSPAENIDIRKEFYDAIIAGYLDVMEHQLTTAEKKYIHYSGILMIYMQALRFITDYLNGDQYYQTTYSEQNLDRAKNQLLLLQKLEMFLAANYGFNG